jgi:hypothetical protein
VVISRLQKAHLSAYSIIGKEDFNKIHLTPKNRVVLENISNNYKKKQLRYSYYSTKSTNEIKLIRMKRAYWCRGQAP